LVTSPPAVSSSRVQKAVKTAKRCSPGENPGGEPPSVGEKGTPPPSVRVSRGPRGEGRRDVLREVVLHRLRGRELVRTPVDGGDRFEVAVARRRGGRPLQGVRLPRVLPHLLAAEDADQEVEHEDDLGRA